VWMHWNVLIVWRIFMSRFNQVFELTSELLAENL
jgi:hypothetical protein